MLNKAIEFAHEKHNGQFRKNRRGDPYITHCVEVKDILLRNGITDEKILSAAVLHDIIEDTTTSISEIDGRFGSDIAGIVMQVSDDKSMSKSMRKQFQMENIIHKCRGARLIKIADKISNCKDLRIDPPIGWNELMINGYIIWSFHVCHNAIKPGDIPASLIEECERLFHELRINDISDDTLIRYLNSI